MLKNNADHYILVFVALMGGYTLRSHYYYVDVKDMNQNAYYSNTSSTATAVLLIQLCPLGQTFSLNVRL